MEVYAFGFNLNGQIRCDNQGKGDTVTEHTHQHFDCLYPTRIEMEDFAISNSSIVQDDNMLISWSWVHLVLVSAEDSRIHVRGTYKSERCKSTCLPNLRAKDISSSWSRTAFVDGKGVCYIWLDHAWDDTPLRVAVPEDKGPAQLVKVAVGERAIAGITDSGCGGLIEKDAKESLIFRPILQSIKIREVSCGKEHTLLLTRIGQVLTLGLGSRGQLGHGSTQCENEARVVEALEGVAMTTVSAGGWHSAAVSDIGDVYTWGWNESGQLGLPSRAVRGRDSATCECINLLTVPHPVVLGDQQEVSFSAVSCGSRHSAAITEAGTLYTWGWNGHGQLGLGDTQPRDTPSPVTFLTSRGLQVLQVTAGSWNTAVIVTRQS